MSNASSIPQLRAAASRDLEWVIGIGNGGFAMGTASGANRRKYHGLLIASLHPPVDRFSCLVHLDEEVFALDEAGFFGKAGDLHSLGRLGGAVLNEGSGFEKTPTSAKWVYGSPHLRIEKELRPAWRRNACAVRYTVRSEGPRLRLRISPHVTMRDFHAVLTGAQVSRWKAEARDDAFLINAEGKTLRITLPGARAVLEPSLITNVRFDLETERRQEDTENVFVPGWFEIDAPAHAQPEWRITLAAALEPDRPDPTLFDDNARDRHLSAIRSRFTGASRELEALGVLVDAADDFLVPRTVEGKELMTVLAGFPWFADWGRDTMISLFGLMLTTRRYEDARGCLETFAHHVSEGMIPNLFDDYGGPPQYNTVDASLWFLHACSEYLAQSGDRATFDSLLLPACLQIIEHYRKGTRYDIRMDPADGLIASGDRTTQLTWMDAKRDGVVFTPRHGKAVEINALWHHGLLSIADALGGSAPRAESLGGTGFQPVQTELRSLASRVADSFRAQFWFEGEQRLHDCLQIDAASSAWKPVPENRPNQIFAVSLKHSPLTSAQQRAVVENVKRHHLTPMGLRTLAPTDPNYCPRFEGDMMSRDRAYHNGTVWPWLIGPYCEAVLRTGGFSDAAKREVREAIRPLMDSLHHGCLGQIAEVYDADEPRRPQGCIAQAWSVAELLRAAVLAV